MLLLENNQQQDGVMKRFGCKVDYLYYILHINSSSDIFGKSNRHQNFFFLHFVNIYIFLYISIYGNSTDLDFHD